MANLNTFKNVSANLTSSNTTVYTAPAGYTSIVLMAQVTNITTSVANVTVGWNNGTTNTELVFNLSTPQNDALNALVGKISTCKFSLRICFS
jgi:uncharacterized membrane protein